MKPPASGWGAGGFFAISIASDNHTSSLYKMDLERQQLLGLIEDYKSAVAKSVSLLNAKSEKERGFQYVRPENHDSRRGYLDASKENTYEFHGVGCFVTTKEFKVDFDFGHERRCDGLDPWFVFHFLEANESIRDKYPLLLSDAHVKSLLQELADEGLASKGAFPSSERTYYLTSDIQNANPVTWKPYWPDDIDLLD